MKLLKLMTDSLELETRAKRRKSVIMVVQMLEEIRFAEEANMVNFPLNLRNSGAYENANFSHDIIIDAICILLTAYD